MRNRIIGDGNKQPRGDLWILNLPSELELEMCRRLDRMVSRLIYSRPWAIVQEFYSLIQPDLLLDM